MKYIAKCGCDCINCPTFKENIQTIADRKKCSTGWQKFLGLNLSPEKLKPCDGCSVPDEKRKIFYLNCKIRKCAIVNQIENCAYCTGFPCNELINAHSVQKICSREAFIKITGKEISESDYELFIKPYSGLLHLSNIRQNLSDTDLKNFKLFSNKAKFTSFPDFKNSNENQKMIYSLLTTLCSVKNVSYAKFVSIEKERELILKTLWSIGKNGIFKENNQYLEVESKIFLSEKITGMYPTLLNYFEILKKYDIKCEIIPLKKEWLTPMGGLRKEGWKMRLMFGEKLKGKKTLLEFKNYVSMLIENYDNKAYRYFTKADFTLMKTISY